MQVIDLGIQCENKTPTILRAELRKVYNLLGFDGEKEVRDIDYDLADTLSRMYRQK